MADVTVYTPFDKLETYWFAVRWDDIAIRKAIDVGLVIETPHPDGGWNYKVVEE